MTDRSSLSRFIVRLSCLCLGLFAVLGCGSSTYEERLDATKERNAYFHRLNERLQNRWMSGMAPNTPSSGLAGVSMRIPNGFQLLLEPTLPPAGDGPAPEPEPDGRNYFGDVELGLPGLLGAWTAGKEGEIRLMLLGNHERFRYGDDRGLGKPEEFYMDLEARLQQLFQVQLPDGDAGQPGTSNVRYRKPLPAVPKFSVARSYTVVEFVPAEGAVPFRAMLFELPNNRIYAAALLITPVDLPSDIRENVLLALETLIVSPEAPLPQAPGATPGAGGAPNRADL